MLDFVFILVAFDFVHHASFKQDGSVFTAAGDACAYCCLLGYGMYFLEVRNMAYRSSKLIEGNMLPPKNFLAFKLIYAN